MRRVAFVIVAELDGDPTDQHVANVLADAAVQVEEPIYERRDDGGDLEGTARILATSWTDAS